MALHFDLHGERGPYMLLLHGMLSSRAQWLANIEALSQHCRLVVTELLAHGRSGSPDDPDAYAPEATDEQQGAANEQESAVEARGVTQHGGVQHSALADALEEEEDAEEMGRGD